MIYILLLLLENIFYFLTYSLWRGEFQNILYSQDFLTKFVVPWFIVGTGCPSRIEPETSLAHFALIYVYEPKESVLQHSYLLLFIKLKKF